MWANAGDRDSAALDSASGFSCTGPGCKLTSSLPLGHSPAPTIPSEAEQQSLESPMGNVSPCSGLGLSSLLEAFSGHLVSPLS